jgi:hypothetical protein
VQCSVRSKLPSSSLLNPLFILLKLALQRHDLCKE